MAFLVGNDVAGSGSLTVLHHLPAGSGGAAYVHHVRLSAPRCCWLCFCSDFNEMKCFLVYLYFPVCVSEVSGGSF